MSIKIHHGPPGSYKTSGAVMDDFIPAAKEGRPIVTNVRGLDDEEIIRESLGKIPETFELIHVDTSNEEGRRKMATWFHWVPKGAFILVDEAQFIWPKQAPKGFIESLSYPGGLDQATEDERPADHYVAFDMHRHYNWDFVLTTPNIAKIRSEIREAAEGAYKHKNLALLGNIPGFTGNYIEAFHLADDNGSNASQFMNVRKRKIKSHVWKLYRSTATGDISDTKAGSNVLLNPRVLMPLGILVGCTVWILSSDLPAIFGGSGNQIPADIPATVAGTNENSRPVSAAPGPAPDRGGAGHVGSGSPPGPFDRYAIRLIGQVWKGDRKVNMFQLQDGSRRIVQTDRDLTELGYKIEMFSGCLAALTWKDRPPRLVDCITDFDKGKEQQGGII